MYVLRHGQSYFNLLFTEQGVDPGIADPELTPLGLEQAVTAARRLEAVPLTRIIVSPYTRALQTAEPIIADHRVPVDIMQEVRERAAFSCDIGTPTHLLAMRFPQHDFGRIPTQWWPTKIESEASTKARATAFRRLVAGRDDSASTLLVSHWAFILALTGLSVSNGELLEYDPKAARARR